jgi:hypothetical protein
MLERFLKRRGGTIVVFAPMEWNAGDRIYVWIFATILE